jgi:hypothetical protein
VIVDYTADQAVRRKVSPLIELRENLKTRFPDAYFLYWPESARVMAFQDICMDDFYLEFVQIWMLVETLKSGLPQGGAAAVRQPGPFSSPAANFNERQMTALRLLCQRESYKGIGNVVASEPQGTVKNIVYQILDAFGLEHNIKKVRPQLSEG